MKVRLKNCGAASPADIANIETRLGIELPESYKKFVTTNDGAEPETNVFGIGNGNESGVNGFIKIRDIEQEAQYIENLGNRKFPVAWAEGGNYVLIDLATGGEVLFWDHENPSEHTLLASDFESFLSLVEPFDVNSIKLKPGQLKSAWIDPDFLKGLTD